MKSRPELRISHVGSKTRSLGQFLEEKKNVYSLEGLVLIQSL